MKPGARSLPFFIAVSLIAVAYSLFITWQYVKLLQGHLQPHHAEHHQIVSADAMRSSIASAALASLQADGWPGQQHQGNREGSAEQPRRAGGHTQDEPAQVAAAQSPPPSPSAPAQPTAPVDATPGEAAARTAPNPSAVSWPPPQQGLRRPILLSSAARVASPLSQKPRWLPRADPSPGVPAWPHASLALCLPPLPSLHSRRRAAARAASGRAAPGGAASGGEATSAAGAEAGEARRRQGRRRRRSPEKQPRARRRGRGHLQPRRGRPLRPAALHGRGPRRE